MREGGASSNFSNVRHGYIAGVRKFIATSLGVLSLFGVSAVGAEVYPDKPIRLIVPYGPGGATDPTARLLAAEMAEKLGQQVIVENKPGLAGSIGAGYVARQPADGYTLLFGGAGNITLRPLMDPNLPYSPERDLATVNYVVNYDHILVVRGDLEVESIEDLVDLAKKNPGKLTYASSGSGGPQHLAMELLKKMAGVDILHIPYKGEAPSLTDVGGGRVDMAISSATGVVPHIQAGRLKAIATTNRERSPALPDLPTVAESGIAGYEADIYGGILVPAGTPEAVIEKLNNVITEIVASPDVRRKFNDSRLTPVGAGPEEFSDFLRNERKKWDQIIKELGTQL